MKRQAGIAGYKLVRRWPTRHLVRLCLWRRRDQVFGYTIFYDQKEHLPESLIDSDRQCIRNRLSLRVFG